MKIMMVCLGNICRSPLAEGIMNHLASAQQLDWTIDSSGTSGWHDGKHPDPRSIKVAAKHGIDISRQRSATFSMYDFDEYDHIIVMDKSNYKDVSSLARSYKDLEKVSLLLSYSSGDREEVPDPYYDGGFQKVYDMIYEACDNFVKLYGVNKLNVIK